MTASRSARAQSLFAAALELTAAERAAFLARECGDDAELLTELRELLAADARMVGMTAHRMGPELVEALAAVAPGGAMTGLRVGAFVLREELGRGGMGHVYRAERVDGTVRQEVAIKFARRELLDASARKRFQLERQLMATLDHPYIARLLDAAELEDCTPYYVMEYVAGSPITAYCAEQRLDVRDRVALIRKVCEGVVEAHRKLVAHRDLKPSNILVTASGSPKLLDFGIAKPLDAALGAPVDATATAERYFSALYAAPEQVRGEPAGISCDVYALGLLLYELLAERRPFDLDRLSAGQIERLITEVPPTAPSDAAARAVSPEGRLRARQLRGDLDGIVLRCLRKAPHERYASVEQLQADLDNYLDGRPVHARGGHGWYRAQKFMRRNLVAVAVGGLAALSLVGGVVAFALQARMTQQRAAELAQVAAFQSKLLGEVNATRLGAFLTVEVTNRFEQAMAKTQLSPEDRAMRVEQFAGLWEELNATDVARALVDEAILRPGSVAIPKQFANQPAIEARLAQALAEQYNGLGLYDSAVPLQQRALALRRDVLGDAHPETLISALRSAQLRADSTTPAEAEPLVRDVLDRSQRALGDAHPVTLDAIDQLARVLAAQGRYADAEPYQRQSLESRRRLLGNDAPDTLSSMISLGQVLGNMSRFDEAEPYLREGLEGSRRVLGEDDWQTLVALNSLATQRSLQSKLVEAEELFRESLEVRRRALGEDHPATANELSNVGDALLRNNKLAEAEPYFREALARRIQAFGRSHPATLLVVNNLAVLRQRQGHLDEAEALFRQALEGNRRVLGETSIETLKSIEILGALLVIRGRNEEALDLLLPIEEAASAAFAAGASRRLPRLLLSLGRARAARHDYEVAEANLLEAERLFRAGPNPRGAEAVMTVEALSSLYSAWDAAEGVRRRQAKAAEWAQRAVELKGPVPESTPR